jgi:hypothetical protein
MIKELNLNKDLQKRDAVLCVRSGACTGTHASLLKKFHRKNSIILLCGLPDQKGWNEFLNTIPGI